jgi:hypothetical protein
VFLLQEAAHLGRLLEVVEPANAAQVPWVGWNGLAAIRIARLDQEWCSALRLPAPYRTSLLCI